MDFSEKRSFLRENISSETKIVSIGKNNEGDVQDIHCLTCNISEGGISIITDTELFFDKYNIIMANQKFPVKVVYRQVIENGRCQTGLMFTRPISDMLKKEIIRNLNNSPEK